MQVTKTQNFSDSFGLGYKADDFIGAYQRNIESQNSEIINSNTLAQAVLIFMQERECWSGTVKEVFEELGRLVTISKDDRTFPKHFNKLRSRLNRIKANLLDYGIKFKIEDFNNHKKGVPISFQKVPKVSSTSSTSSVAAKIAGIQVEHVEDKKHTFWKEEEKEISESNVIDLSNSEILEVIE